MDTFPAQLPPFSSQTLHSRVATLAEQRHGVVTTAAMRDVGASDSWIAHQKRIGYLHPVHRRVVAVGHRGLSREGWWSAAVQAAGPGAALAGFAAAAHWRMTRRTTCPTRVLVPRPRRSIEGVQLREAPWIETHVIRHRCIDVLSPAATIASVAAECGVGELVYMVREARFRGYDVLDELLQLARDGTRRPGSPRLRDAIFAYLAGDGGSDSRFEDAVYAIVEDVLPTAPVRNMAFSFAHGEGRLDIAWPDQLICVEADGTASHARPDQRRIDRRRSRDLCSRGWWEVRVTQEEFERDRVALAQRLRAAVRAGAERGGRSGTPPTNLATCDQNVRWIGDGGDPADEMVARR